MVFIKEGLKSSKDLYFQLLRSRLVQERIQYLHSQKIVTSHLYLELGEEAITVGCDAALEDGDYIAAYWRGAGTCLVRRGLPLKNLMAWWLGKEDKEYPVRMMLPTSYGNVKEGLVPRLDSCLGSEMDLAAGFALTTKLSGKKNIVAVMIGEGATNRSNFHESLTLASLQKLPLVYVCRTNGWAMSTPTHKTIPVDSVVEMAPAYGIKGIEVDGNDIIAVIDALKEAFAHARAGGGPVLVNAITYRIGPHSANDEDDYRPEGELDYWKEKDPIKNLEKFLEIEGVLPSELVKIKQEVADLIVEAEEYAMGLPEQKVSSILDKQEEILKKVYGEI